MIIREFKRSDVKRVLEIETASFRDPYPANILVDIYNLGAGFLVAQENNRVVGYIIFWIKFEEEGHIISIAVDKNYRRMEVGSRLVEKSLNIFKKYNVKSIKLEVRMGNKGARKFYSKMGFKEEKVVENYYEDNEDAIIMSQN
ncbi:MAG: ribosomal protein S18-alanine N-acetyltransferase [Methanobacterium sp.]|nr:ribosomal protein S18-alanine N-acetyltransferase [Methanobacterium sp.]